jgi:phospholipid/cholesterol/gamma-HCH transport system substrate-binding protein
MITRATAIRGILFVVLTVGLVLYVGAHFLGVFSFVGKQDYNVRMPISDASGLFPRAEVTYRGVKVGEVGPLELTPEGVDTILVVKGGGPDIPSDLKAVVASRSAVGERFVDLLPNRAQGPFLKDGDVIPADRVTLPTPVQDVLKNLDQLAATVPLPDLQTTVSELSKAFDNLGPKLQLLLDSTHSLVSSANAYLPQTIGLIHDARTVLNTQNDLSDPIKSFSSDLKKITEQLKDSDPDVRDLLKTGPDAGRELSALIDESGDGLHDTIKEGLTLSQITRDHVRDIQSVLQLYPGLAAAIPTILPSDGSGRAQLGLVLNIDNPPVCTNGYEATDIQAGQDTTPPDPLNYRAYCREPIFSPTDVRGIKPQYPFRNDQPQVPPDWFFAFYQDGPEAGIHGKPTERSGHHPDRERQSVNTSFNPAGMPLLLSAPATTGQFGLVHTVLGNG